VAGENTPVITSLTPPVEICPAGSFDANGQGLCVQCSPGFFASNENSRSCRKCPRGSIAARAGAKDCTKCRGKRVANRLRTACVTSAIFKKSFHLDMLFRNSTRRAEARQNNGVTTSAAAGDPLR
jgi:hypothetical protein